MIVLMAGKPDEDAARGKRIQAMREAAKLTQSKVAQRLGVDTSSVSRWERGQGLRAPVAAKLARLLGTTAEYLISGGAVMNTEPPYEAWRAFLGWLETAPDRAHVEPWMLDALRGLRGKPGKEPTIESYQRALFALFTWREGPDGGDGTGA